MAIQINHSTNFALRISYNSSYISTNHFKGNVNTCYIQELLDQNLINIMEYMHITTLYSNKKPMYLVHLQVHKP